MIKVGDYVEGIEFFGKTKRVMRGTVDCIYANGDMQVQCDDNYNGARANILVAAEREIKVVEKELNWWSNLVFEKRMEKRVTHSDYFNFIKMLEDVGTSYIIREDKANMEYGTGKAGAFIDASIVEVSRQRGITQNNSGYEYITSFVFALDTGKFMYVMNEKQLVYKKEGIV